MGKGGGTENHGDENLGTSAEPGRTPGLGGSSGNVMEWDSQGGHGLAVLSNGAEECESRCTQDPSMHSTSLLESLDFLMIPEPDRFSE